MCDTNTVANANAMLQQSAKKANRNIVAYCSWDWGSDNIHDIRGYIMSADLMSVELTSLSTVPVVPSSFPCLKCPNLLNAKLLLGAFNSAYFLSWYSATNVFEKAEASRRARSRSWSNLRLRRERERGREGEIQMSDRHNTHKCHIVCTTHTFPCTHLISAISFFCFKFIRVNADLTFV